MKKYFLLVAVTISTALFAQNPEIPSTTSTNYIPAAPSVSSLMNFAEIPVNEFTGIPDISEPLFSSKTLSNLVNFNIGYAYHPKGISILQQSSDLGTGWSLNCGGSISRMVMHRPEVSNQNYQNSSHADTYFFNFMGFSGSFQIKYGLNNINPEIIVKRTDQSNLKIEFIKDPNSNKIDSFTIFDTKGIKYVFSVFDINVSTFYMNTPSNPVSTIGERNKMKIAYRSSWHLKEVVDNNNNKIIDFTYQTFFKTDPTYVENPLVYQTQKLKVVTVLGCSKIELTYTYNPEMDDINTNYQCDPYNLNSILISDIKNNIIKKIIPEIQYVNFPIYERDKIYSSQIYYKPKVRRYLSKLKEVDKFNQKINETSFVYNLNFEGNLFLDSSGYLDKKEACFIKNSLYPGTVDDLFNDFLYATSNKETSNIGILKAISYQIGGGYEFIFESNTFSKNFNNEFSDKSFSLLNEDNKKYDLLYDLSYDTNINQFVEFNLSNTNNENKLYYFKFENEVLNIPSQISNINTTEHEEVEYKLINLNNCNEFPIPELFSDHILTGIFNFGQNCIGKSMYLSPCEYKIQILPYMMLNTKGKIKIYVENYKSNLEKFIYGGGNRIKSILKYENLSISDFYTFEKENLISSTHFEYNNFDNNLKSSGELSYGRLGNSMYNDDVSSDYQVNYKNVKKISNDLGYTKTTFKLPSESINGYNSLKDGLPELIQIFDSNHKILVENNFNYLFEQDPNLTFVLDYNNITPNSYQTLIKNKEITTKNYFYPNGGNTPNIVTSNETFTYNSLNKQIATHTVSNSVGETLTTNYFYHTGNSPFSQNRISEIERIETKNGTTLLSESKINYSNTFAGNQSFLPSSIEVKKGNSPSEIRLRNNMYDAFGHVLEVQQESGMKISYIYGYNNTQPVAKIENIAYANIPANLISAIQNASNGTDEIALNTALNNLRTALPNTMITTLTYKPLIGVSSVTDPKGDKQTYHYDSFNRLEFVKDSNGNILSENTYYYKN